MSWADIVAKINFVILNYKDIPTGFHWLDIRMYVMFSDIQINRFIIDYID